MRADREGEEREKSVRREEKVTARVCENEGVNLNI